MASEITNPQYDLIVIGAGINGAGIARDASMRGLKILLLDKGDIGSGTSSWSTRLIHGGLRYLEHGEVGLVRESLRERARLMNIAPHLVRPLEIMVPIYKHARRGFWTLRAGMIAYDVLSFAKDLPGHRMLSASDALRLAPGLNPEGLLGAAVYFDAQLEFAERLVVENALSAREHGASVSTYARVDKINVEGGKVRGVEFINERQRSNPSIREGVDRDRNSARAQVVINAAGPWIDQLLGTTVGDSPRLIGGTKGSHLIVAPFAGAPQTAIYVEAKTDRRPFFIIPWNEHYLIGTTDIRFNGDLDRVRIETDETEYLLRETNRVLPAAKLTHEQILYTYSGVRPLPFTGDKDEQSITRRHFIRRHPDVDNLFSIVGGKLTTYRSLAAETVDLVLQKLGRDSAPCTTDREPLPGADTPDFAGFCKDFNKRNTLPPAIRKRLLGIYGTRASLITELLAGDPSLAEVIDSETGAIAAEIVFAFQDELARTLSDCLLRRTMVGLNSTCGLNAVDAAARIAQRHLGWSEDRAAREIADYREEVSSRFCG